MVETSPGVMWAMVPSDEFSPADYTRTTGGQSLVGRDHARPIEWLVLLLEAVDYALLFPQIDFSWSPPPARLQLEQISDNFAREVPGGKQSKPTETSADCH